MGVDVGRRHQEFLDSLASLTPMIKINWLTFLRLLQLELGIVSDCLKSITYSFNSVNNVNIVNITNIANNVIIANNILKYFEILVLKSIKVL